MARANGFRRAGKAPARALCHEPAHAYQVARPVTSWLQRRTYRLLCPCRKSRMRRLRTSRRHTSWRVCPSRTGRSIRPWSCIRRRPVPPPRPQPSVLRSFSSSPFLSHGPIKGHIRYSWPPVDACRAPIHTGGPCPSQSNRRHPAGQPGSAADPSPGCSGAIREARLRARWDRLRCRPRSSRPRPVLPRRGRSLRRQAHRLRPG